MQEFIGVSFHKFKASYYGQISVFPNELSEVNI